jgi:hypothetical protein
METINFIDRSKAQYVQNGLTFLCDSLKADGIRANWYASPKDAEPGAILLLHDPEEPANIPQGCRVLGQRSLNRRERLVLAERCGLPVVKWCVLESMDDIAGLFDLWGVDNLLAKADWSYSRGGIKRLTKEDCIPFSSHNYNADADVFMRILNGSPDTHKVDLFYTQQIACRHMYTRSVFDSNFYKGFTKHCNLGTIPSLEEGLTKLGQELMNYGQGLSGVDFMYDENNNPWVIELNTSSLGREGIWNRWREPYLAGYLGGLRQWIAAGCPAQFCNGLSPKAKQLSDRSGGSYPSEASQPVTESCAFTQTENWVGGIE